ncbi:hypothetical protein FB451DRAFT_1411520 [Mycena latifolia]|nr:hypothetical protein FB451DRAFT_1411520 [Mycena latifolia]
MPRLPSRVHEATSDEVDGWIASVCPRDLYGTLVRVDFWGRSLRASADAEPSRHPLPSSPQPTPDLAFAPSSVLSACPATPHRARPDLDSLGILDLPPAPADLTFSFSAANTQCPSRPALSSVSLHALRFHSGSPRSRPY